MGKRSPVAKKVKMEALNIDGVEEDPCLKMKGLSPSQVIGIVSRLIAKHPELESEVSELLPAEPDLAPYADTLNYLKKNISKSLPNTRLESKTDSLAYNRVSTHLLALKKAIFEQGKVLVESKQWRGVLEHVTLAWAVVKSTPVWDNPPHNNVRKQCFKSLAANAMQAIKKAKFNSHSAKEIKDK